MANLKLHNPDNFTAKQKNRFCGPQALTIITGVPSYDNARRIREATGRKMITGCHWHELDPVLRKYHNLKLERVTVGCARAARDPYKVGARAYLTYKQWLKSSKAARTPGRVFLLTVGNHWVVVSGRKAACGLSGTVDSVRGDANRMRARVTEVFEVVDL